MNKIILSRKGYDDQYGGKPSVVLQDRTMLSFPIPASEAEAGIQSSELRFGNRTLAEIFTELGQANISRNHHVDPDIYQLAGMTTMGAFGQAGAALSHLDNRGVGKGDIFLFFGTFCMTNDFNGQLEYEMMHPFHALFGYLVVNRRVTIDEIEKEKELNWLKEHPHYINRGYGDYNKATNAIYIGKEYGYFRFSEKLRLTKPGYKKSYWQLPTEFQDVELSYHDKSKQRITENSVEFTSVYKGQEFVFEREERLEKWLQEVLKHKI
jgi:hypothetical protein